MKLKRFPSEEAWLINPDRPGRSTRKKRSSTMARRKRSRKHSAKRSRRRKVAVLALNPPKRRRSRRSVRRNPHRRYRRNPGILPSTGMVFDAMYVTGGFIGTKLAANFVLPMIGIQQPIVRIGLKGVLAGALGWAGNRFLGRSAGQFLLIGGLVEAVNDAVQTYVSPYVPALAVSAYPELSYNGGDYMGSYPGMSAYPDLSGLVAEDTMEQV